MSTGRRSIPIPFVARLLFMFSFDFPHEINHTNFDEFDSLFSDLQARGQILNSSILKGQVACGNISLYDMERKEPLTPFKWFLMCKNVHTCPYLIIISNYSDCLIRVNNSSQRSENHNRSCAQCIRDDIFYT